MALLQHPALLLLTYLSWAAAAAALYHRLRRRANGSASLPVAWAIAVVAGGLAAPGIVSIPHATTFAAPGAAVWTGLFAWAKSRQVNGLDGLIAANALSHGLAAVAVAFYETRRRWAGRQLVRIVVTSAGLAVAGVWANSYPRPYSEPHPLVGYVVGCGPVKMSLLKQEGCALQLRDDSMVLVDNVPRQAVSTQVLLHRRSRLLYGSFYEYVASDASPGRDSPAR